MAAQLMSRGHADHFNKIENDHGRAGLRGLALARLRSHVLIFGGFSNFTPTANIPDATLRQCLTLQGSFSSSPSIAEVAVGANRMCTSSPTFISTGTARFA